MARAGTKPGSADVTLAPSHSLPSSSPSRSARPPLPPPRILLYPPPPAAPSPDPRPPAPPPPGSARPVLRPRRLTSLSSSICAGRRYLPRRPVAGSSRPASSRPGVALPPPARGGRNRPVRRLLPPVAPSRPLLLRSRYLQGGRRRGLAGVGRL